MNMPSQTPQAVAWALQQTTTDISGDAVPITKLDYMPLVDAVRNYFNTNNIVYSTFSYTDLEPYL